MSRRIEYTEFGGPEVLHIVEVDPPHPAPGEIRVRVLATGINPVDAKVFRNLSTAIAHDVDFPSGNGIDFAGVIDEVGTDVTAWQSGDSVMGGRMNHAQADFLVIASEQVIAVPDGLDWERAGSLDTVGRTAWASVKAVNPGPDDVVLVSAAAGGVGGLAVQLAKRTGATVIGTASESNHDFLRELGIVPVAYGDGMEDAVRRVSPGGITAALDNHGHGFVQKALALGATPGRINTIADYEAPEKFGVLSAGGAQAGKDDLRRVAELIAGGALEFPIDSIFPLERADAAYERLLAGHLRGKIVLVTQ